MTTRSIWSWFGTSLYRMEVRHPMRVVTSGAAGYIPEIWSKDLVTTMTIPKPFNKAELIARYYASQGRCIGKPC